MLVELALAGLLIYLIYRTTARPANFPPGPWNLPVIGYLPFMTRYPEKKYIELSKIYGDVFSIQLGSFPTVILSSLKVIKEAFKEDALAGRPDFLEALLRSNKKGIILSEGQPWVELRRFTLRNLRDFGMGRSSLEGIIMEEIKELISSLQKNEGKPMKLGNSFNLAVVNALWTIVSGERFSHDDPEAVKVITELTERVRESQNGSVSNVLPWLAKLDFFTSNMKKSLQNNEDIKAIVKRIIDKHLANHSSGQESDFTHVFLNKMEEHQSDPDSPFHGRQGLENLVMVLVDLFIAGTETTSTTLLWLVLLMATHPDIQSKVQAEIDAVIPSGQLPSNDVRSRMPYTEAVLMEVMRYITLTPLGVAHASLQDTKFLGYDIPKGTLLFANLYHVMHDPGTWKKPNEFYPEHFLHADGSLKPSEALIPFSYGKRLCLGESLAKMELFLFGVSLLQHFSFEFPADQPKPSLEPLPSVVYSPQPFDILVTKRKSAQL